MKALPLVPQIPGREREIRDASHFGAGQTLAKNRSGNQLLSDISFALILDFDGFLVTTKSRVRAFLAPKGKSGSISMSRVLPVKSATCRRDRVAQVEKDGWVERTDGWSKKKRNGKWKSMGKTTLHTSDRGKIDLCALRITTGLKTQSVDWKRKSMRAVGPSDVSEG
ncbi:hypothetical protein RUM44_003713 [Polyplax serrata]|uniref:Uncharacterized protein n=1 Tax=Polyplax serrata TaxID=468196 RepID=A0ABR1AH86_POLSC